MNFIEIAIYLEESWPLCTLRVIGKKQNPSGNHVFPYPLLRNSVTTTATTTTITIMETTETTTGTVGVRSVLVESGSAVM